MDCHKDIAHDHVVFSERAKEPEYYDMNSTILYAYHDSNQAWDEIS